MAITKEELKEILEVKVEEEIRESTLTKDGKNLLTRIPKMIRETLQLKPKDKLSWQIKEGKIIMEVIRNDKKKD